MRKMLCTVGIVLATLASSAMAQTIDSPIVGLWKVDSVTWKDAANQVTKPLGDHPGGYVLYTKGGHILVTQMDSNRTAPAAAAPTDAEAAKLLASMVSVAGTYKIEGNNKIVVHLEQSWNQMGIGVDLPREFKISGNQLTVTFTAKSPMTGQDVLVTVSLERAE
jgi:hypothetical protein